MKTELLQPHIWTRPLWVIQKSGHYMIGKQLKQGIIVEELSCVRRVGIQCKFWYSNNLLFYFYTWHPPQNVFFLRIHFSFALEYESPMSERHDSVHLEEKIQMSKTSAAWEHFKLSEDKTKAVCQICNLKLACHNCTSSLKKNHLSFIWMFDLWAV